MLFFILTQKPCKNIQLKNMVNYIKSIIEVFGLDTDKTGGLINERNEIIVGQIT